VVVKRVDHPLTGPIEFECQVMHIQDTDQRLIVYVARPGSVTAAAFGRLAATATSTARTAYETTGTRRTAVSLPLRHADLGDDSHEYWGSAANPGESRVPSFSPSRPPSRIRCASFRGIPG
jgi:hypothetical protein